MSANPPYTYHFDLASVSERGEEIILTPTPAERAALASWLGALSLDSFEAKVRIARSGMGRYTYEAEFAAGVTQACVITLEPVSSTLEGEFQRSFLVEPKATAARREALGQPRSRKIEVLAAADDEPELIAGSEIDLAAPILEELALALDPYPRAPGAELPAKDEPAAPGDSPFAVLGKLKQPGEAASESAAASTAKPSKRPPKR
jgi:uncharacterized metal-binding protein YceD (DUF177 family)